MKVVNANAQYRLYGDNLVVYDKLPADVYIIRFNELQGFYLEKYSMEVNEEKVYGVHKSKIEKVKNAFKNSQRSLGVILSGDKGIGKSLFARMLSLESVDNGYPVIIVDRYVQGINSFIEEIEQEVVVLFDEFDKTFVDNDGDNCAQTSMLSLFDGVAAGKKLYIVTCNNVYKLNEYLINRPGRFHYHFRFKYPTSEEIKIYLQDKLDKKYWSEIDSVINFCGKVELNYDCLRAIAFELQNGETFEDAINDLNVINIDEQKYDVLITFKDGKTLARESVSINMFSSKPQKFWVENMEEDESLYVEFSPNNVIYDYTKGLSSIESKHLKLSQNKKYKNTNVESAIFKRTIMNNYNYAI